MTSHDRWAIALLLGSGMLAVGASSPGAGGRTPRALNTTEKAATVGGYQQTFPNSCCTTAAACVLPQNNLCADYGRASCGRKGQELVSGQENNTDCSGGGVTTTCNESNASVVCVTFFSCYWSTTQNECLRNPGGQSEPAAYAPFSCAPYCP